MKKHKLAIIGSGSLGSIIGEVAAQGVSEEYEILGVLSGRIENAIKLADEIGSKAYKTLGEIIDDKLDYVPKNSLGYGQAHFLGLDLLQNLRPPNPPFKR